MKLKSIKVSNILSYDLLNDFDKAPNTIEFKDDLNILIGSNGSGKSNLLEIINGLFQIQFFRNYYIDDERLGRIISNVQPSIMVKTNKPILQDNEQRLTSHIVKNIDHLFDSSRSHLQVEIFADDNDIKNLLYLFQRKDELKRFYQKYCIEQSMVETLDLVEEEDIKKMSVFKFKFNVNEDVVGFGLESALNNIERLFYNYLVYFNQLKLLSYVINTHENILWEDIKQPFGLLSSMRQYGGFLTSYSVGTRLNRKIKEANSGHVNSAKDYVSANFIFETTGTKIAQHFRALVQEGGEKHAFDTINRSDYLLTQISNILNKNIGLLLRIEDYDKENDTISLNIYRDDKKIDFLQLSTGEKNIFYLLFSVYGYDLKNGVLLIDEPELHLHVTLQKKYFKILKEIQKEINVQIIIATHSSIFINENTINNTFRFFLNNNYSSVFCPEVITQSQKDLIKILTYTNSSRIFFADTVLLVEGDSDEYFFNFFYENYFRKKLDSKINLEILYIAGKGNYKKWKEFLDLFRINSFFIGDFDNINEFKIPEKTGFNYKMLVDKSKEKIISKIVNEKITPKETKDGKALLKQLDLMVENNFVLTEKNKKELNDLWIYLIEKQGIKKSHIIEYLKEDNQEHLFTTIKEEIKKLYAENIFILQEGDLENYLNLSNVSKDLMPVIDFCQNRFNAWILEQEEIGTNSKLNELESIFQKICKA
ncbi:MAG TPA: AAA family ATPase [Cytophagaceae bacterium]|jgi:predicted ATP-dependent endonuclease of OLD family|nr:AAA family ATPase [Cytophagaceae bacterium]